MDLSSALEAHAARVTEGAEQRLANPTTAERIAKSVRRAKRRANAIVAASTVAVIAFAAAAWAAPRDPEPPVTPTPSPTHTPLPAIDTVDYLVNPGGAFVTDEAISCQQIPTVPLAEDAIAYPGTMPPLPTWIEANRIYGIADGMPPSYPIPLYSTDAMFYQLAVSEILRDYSAGVYVQLALIAGDGSWWGFTARYAVVDEMPFDDPGLFVSLTPDPECQGGPRAIDRSRIPADHYNARMMVTRADGTVISDFGDVQIVTGLPSIPFLRVTE